MLPKFENNSFTFHRSARQIQTFYVPSYIYFQMDCVWQRTMEPKKKISHTLNIKSMCCFQVIFFLFLFSFRTHDMLFSLITFTEQQGESLPRLFEVFGGFHRFGPENGKK